MDAKYLFLAILFSTTSQLVSSSTIYNPYFHFPGGSDPFMGMIVTVAVPVEADTPGEVLLSTILEGNYLIPTNETEFEYPPLVEDSSERSFLYELINRKIEDFGYSGKNCLLRAICEMAQISSANTGILGDLFHLFLTPSSSKPEKKLKEYYDAEVSGVKRGCKQYKKLCPYSFLNAITKIKF